MEALAKHGAILARRLRAKAEKVSKSN
jgi:hypothetical protein